MPELLRFLAGAAGTAVDPIAADPIATLGYILAGAFAMPAALAASSLVSSSKSKATYNFARR